MLVDDLLGADRQARAVQASSGAGPVGIAYRYRPSGGQRRPSGGLPRGFGSALIMHDAVPKRGAGGDQGAQLSRRGLMPSVSASLKACKAATAVQVVELKPDPAPIRRPSSGVVRMGSGRGASAAQRWKRGAGCEDGGGGIRSACNVRFAAVTASQVRRPSKMAASAATSRVRYQWVGRIAARRPARHRAERPPRTASLEGGKGRIPGSAAIDTPSPATRRATTSFSARPARRARQRYGQWQGLC